MSNYGKRKKKKKKRNTQQNYVGFANAGDGPQTLSERWSHIKSELGFGNKKKGEG